MVRQSIHGSKSNVVCPDGKEKQFDSEKLNDENFRINDSEKTNTMMRIKEEKRRITNRTGRENERTRKA